MAMSSSKTPGVLVVHSGGLDSTTLLYWAIEHYGKPNVRAISFYYGSKHNARELACADVVGAKLRLTRHVHDLSACFDSDSGLMAGKGKVPDGHYADASMQQTVVPLRNGVMLMVAASVAESMGLTHIALGAHAGDHAIYPDCRPEFLRAAAEAIALGTYAQIGLLRPFAGFDKARIVTEGARLEVDFTQTWSCYRGEDVSCGRCGTCTERLMAFDTAGLKDPLQYADRSYYRTLSAQAT